MPVANADAPILAMFLPTSSAPIIRSRIANRLETTAASRLPCFDSRSMLAREAPVSAVSLAEKNAETRRQARRMENVSQSMACDHFIQVFKLYAPAWLAENRVPTRARRREQSRRGRQR